jgi:hypothetical protein
MLARLPPAFLRTVSIPRKAAEPARQTPPSPCPAHRRSRVRRIVTAQTKPLEVTSGSKRRRPASLLGQSFTEAAKTDRSAFPRLPKPDMDSKSCSEIYCTAPCSDAFLHRDHKSPRLLPRPPPPIQPPRDHAQPILITPTGHQCRPSDRSRRNG